MKRFAIVLLLVGGTAAAQMSTPNLPQCNISHVQGTYVATYQGWVAVPVPNAAPMLYPGAMMGVLSIGSTGAFTGTFTAILPISGKTTNEVMPGGVVDIKPDCTGTVRFSIRGKGTSEAPTNEIHRLVYLRERGEFMVIMEVMERGGVQFIPMFRGSWKQLAKWPNEAEW